MRKGYLLLQLLRVVIDTLAFISIVFTTDFTPSLFYSASPTLIYIASYFFMVVLMQKVQKTARGFILGLPSLALGTLSILYLLNIFTSSVILALVILVAIELIMIAFTMPHDDSKFKVFLDTSREYHYFYYIFISIGLGLLYRHTNSILFFVTLGTLILSSLLYIYLQYEEGKNQTPNRYSHSIRYLPIILVLNAASIFAFSMSFILTLNGNTVFFDINFIYLTIAIVTIIYPLYMLRKFRFVARKILMTKKRTD